MNKNILHLPLTLSVIAFSKHCDLPLKTTLIEANLKIIFSNPPNSRNQKRHSLNLFHLISMTVWTFYHKMQEKKTQVSIYYVTVSTGQKSGSTLAGSSSLRLYLKPQSGFWAPWRRGALGRCMQVALGTHWLLVSNKNSSPCEHACLQLYMSFFQIKEYKRQWKSNPRQGPFFLTFISKAVRHTFCLIPF